MKKIWLVFSLLWISASCFGGQGDVTPRKQVEPWDNAKIKGIQAKRWVAQAAMAQTETTESGSIPGKKSCTTQVGDAPAPSNQLRYGPQTKQQMVVVTGDVINVCN